MPGVCHFQEIWLEDPGRRLWLRKGNNVFSGFCSVCKKPIDISHSGVTALRSHENGKKHKQLVNNLNSGKQSTLHSFQVRSQKPISQDENSTTNRSNDLSIPGTSNEIASCSRPTLDYRHDNTLGNRPGPVNNIDDGFNKSKPGEIYSPPNISSFLVSESITKAEIIWACHCVSSHTSTRSGSNAVELFEIMFPDSHIASKLNLHKDKIGYSVTYGLGPYFFNQVSAAALKSPFYALSIDESLNDVCQKQQMDIVINFWDSETNHVNTRYLTSAFLGTSSAEDLLTSVTKCIKDANLSLDKLVQLATDGPNVNLKLLFDINNHMKTVLPSEKQILNTGTCSLHIVNGAYKTAHQKVRWTLNQFLRQLYRLFKNFPSRRSVYTQVTGSSVFPKKFCAIRWIENSLVIKRAIEMLPHLQVYFDNVGKNAPDSQNFTAVKTSLQDRTLEAKLHFACMISEELEEFLVLFQKNVPLLPFLYEEIFSLMKNVATRFVKRSVMETITTASKLKNLDISCNENLKSFEIVEIGFGAKASLKNVKDIDVSRFKNSCKSFLIELFAKLIDKSPLKRRVVLGASCLNPSIMNNAVLRESRVKIAIEECVAINQMTPAEGDRTLRAYKTFCENKDVKEKIKNFNWKKDRLDIMFSELFETLSHEIDPKFINFVKMILISFHGNAAVERSFSFNKNFLVENLQQKSLVAQRLLHDHLINLPDGLIKMEISKKMIQEFRNASSRRKEDLKRKKEEESAEETFRKKALLDKKELLLKKQRLEAEREEVEKELQSVCKVLRKK